jgi:simple sugar transport system substrate-binding protein
LLALLVVFAMIAAGCGDDADTTTTAGGGDEVTTTTAGGGDEVTTTTAGGGDESTTTTAAGGAGVPEDFQIGMILVGPQNDRGWSQAHYEAGLYVMEKLGLPEENLIVLDKMNTADRPETTIPDVVDDMLDQGADLVFATSDDMKDGILEAAAQHPDVPMIWSSGDNAWTDGKDYRADLTNLGNIMGRMEYGKAIAGCAAALTTQTGNISYLGPLINDETRRLVNSAYLGADYCWTEVLGNDSPPAFEVKWIGFWFNIPGFTLDPTQVTNEFLADGSDVVISGIDTTEALVRAGQEQDQGNDIWAVPYDYEDACAEAPQACLGVPYFHWGPEYLKVARSVIDGTFSADFVWVGPDWNDINNPDTTAVGWYGGDALSADAAASLDEFIAGLAAGEIDLWVGPLEFQDGSTWLADGEQATDFQIWYTEQLLAGIEGASAAE